MARTKTLAGHGAGIDTSDFRALAKVLRSEAPQLARDLTKELRQAGELVAEDAREIVGEFSKSIPPTIKVRVSSTTVAVVAGGRGVAIANLFERGNTKSSQSAQTFRHPVFGNRDVWVEQAKHPFLRRAGEQQAIAVEVKVGLILDGVTARIKFNVEGG